MKIETTRQVDEESLRINNTVDISLRTIGDNVYVQLFSRYELKGWLIVRDMVGGEHLIAIETANNVILDQILNSTSTPDNP